MKKSILIELTPLLDVILILLFLVLTGVSTQVKNVQTAAEQKAAAADERESALQIQLSEASQKRLAAEQALTSFTLVDENCRILTLTVADADGIRAMTLAGDDGAQTRVQLSGTDEVYLRNVLKSTLKKASILQSGGLEQAVFFVFQYDRRCIYQSEYIAIHAALLDCSGVNVYYAEYDMTK